MSIYRIYQKINLISQKWNSRQRIVLYALRSYHTKSKIFGFSFCGGSSKQFYRELVVRTDFSSKPFIVHNSFRCEEGVLATW